jgi:hypothetical protein
VILHELAITPPDVDGHSCEELSFLFVSMMHAHCSFVASLVISVAHSRPKRSAIDRLIAPYVNDTAARIVAV